jgi:hypothetical protein
VKVRSHLVSLGRLLFITSPVIGRKGSCGCALSLEPSAVEETRMLNLMEQLSCLLLNICGGLTFEVLSVLKNLFGTLKGIENNESFFLLGLTLKGLGTVLLPELTHELLWSLVLTYQSPKKQTTPQ